MLTRKLSLEEELGKLKLLKTPLMLMLEKLLKEKKDKENLLLNKLNQIIKLKE